MKLRFCIVVCLLTILLSLPRFAHHTPDSKHYIDLAKYFQGDLNKEDIRAPFAYRVLIPFMASLGPSKNLNFNFAIINVLCTTAAYLIFSVYLRQFFTSQTELNVGMLILIVSFPTLNYSSGVLTDPSGFLVFIAAVYLLSKKKYCLFSFTVSLGILARDSVLGLVLIAVLFVVMSHFYKKEKPLWMLLPIVSIPPVIVFIAIRAFFSYLPQYVWYPSLRIVMENITRPISLLAVFLTLSPLMLLYGIGAWKNRSLCVRQLPRQQKMILLSTFIGGILIVIYSIVAAFMCGRFFWPLYSVFIPMTILASRDTFLFVKVLSPVANKIFGHSDSNEVY